MNIKIFTLLFLVFFSCQTKNASNHPIFDYVNSLNVKLDENNKMVLIVPLNGCEGCIMKTIDFIKDNINNEDFIFIVSGTGVKEVSIRFDTLSAHRRLIVDNHAEAQIRSLVTFYPVIYRIDKANEVSKEELNGSSIDSVLSKIK